MSTVAKVGSIDALRQLRAAMVKFAETANAALGDAESEIQRVITWVEHDQTTYWSGQLRKRQDALVKAKEALRMKQIFKDSTGARQQTVEEEKAVMLATRRVQEAEQKMANVKRWSRQLEKEFHLYRGGVQRLGTSILADVPNALAKLDRMAMALDGYINLGAPSEVTSTVEQGSGTSMAKPQAGPPEVGDVYRALRARSPKPEARDQISAGDPSRLKWPQPLPQLQIERLNAIQLQRETIDPRMIVVYGVSESDGKKVYLHRQRPAFPGDSGWYIGPTDGAPTAPETAQAEEFQALWPDLQHILACPTDTLIVFDGTGIAAILDSTDKDLWPQ